jgi:aspartate/methionine/tyrosine aminotransferase
MHDYGPMRTVLANFMGIVMGGRLTFDPAGVIITAGAGAAIEMLVFCLAQPGEAILIPSPYYHGYFTYLLPCIHHPCILLRI